MSAAARDVIDPPAARRLDARPAGAAARIVARASTLWDRIGGGYRPAVGEDAPARDRLVRWIDRGANGEAESFRRRLDWLGLGRDDVLPLLGDVELEGPAPAWAAVLDEVLSGAEDPDWSNAEALGGHPFADLFASFAASGLRRLEPGTQGAFAPTALADLVGDLVRALSFFAGPVLHLEFSAFRAGRGEAETAAPGEGLYREFVAGLKADPVPFLMEYAALARLLCTATLLWSRNVTSLARALREDAGALAERFNQGRPLGRPVAVACTLSDRHKGGATVSILTFEGGLRLVHKPRDLSVETAWFDVLQALDGPASEDRLRRLEVLGRGDHGWVEMVEAAPCRDQADARRFYRRAGALLAVLYALEASDCFHENIIAAGDHPVLIDMETLMHHVLRQATELGPAEAAAGDALFDSVFRAGFLPSWETGMNGVAVDISGLGARAGQPTPYVRRRWEAVNTDAMTLRYEPLAIELEIHLPHLDGAPLAVADYADEVIDGFRDAYERIMRRAAEAGGSFQQALERLGRSEIRLVFHATRIYALLQKRLFAPRHMRAGIDRSLELDVLARFYLASRAKQPFRALLGAEIAAMEDLDIPYFRVRADSRDLVLPDGTRIEGAFEQTAIERVRRRIAAFGPDDLARQVEFIRASLGLSALNLSGAEHGGGEAAGVGPAASELAVPTPDELIAEARRIGREIEQRAIVSADGSATWIAPQQLPGMSHYELRVLRHDLYAGAAGLGLFFAGLERVCGEGRAPALAALAPLRRFLADATPERLLREGYPLGAGTGAGSFVYALAQCAGLLNEPALLEDARRAAALVTPGLIAADESLDVLSGAAGAALALLALQARTGEPDLLRAARLCGERLIERQEPMPRGAAWRTGHGRALAGMSHGAAGIALALTRLGSATGERRFIDAAGRAVAYEDWLFDRERDAWPDLRHDGAEPPAFMNAWCHGAVGIGFARLGAGQAPGGPAARTHLDAAIRSSASLELSAKDGLCCGNLGRAALLAAGGRRGRPDAAAAAADLAGAVLARARAAGGYRLAGRKGVEFFDPSFFQGLSGVGYQLLSLGAPGVLPDVLAWAP